MKPVILLVIANDAAQPLAGLAQELRAIQQSLDAAKHQGTIQLELLPYAHTQDIIQALNKWRENLLWFHYAGHANGRVLALEDGHGHGSGLAGLLGDCPQLKGVFLNGCATWDHVKRLLAAGIPTVLATHEPIQDRQAVSFAENFYRKLANKGSVEQAFQFAQHALQLQYGERTWAMKAIDRQRDLVFELNESGEISDQFPWGLRYDQDQAEALHWMLPTAARKQADAPALCRRSLDEASPSQPIRADHQHLSCDQPAALFHLALSIVEREKQRKPKYQQPQSTAALTTGEFPAL